MDNLDPRYLYDDQPRNDRAWAITGLVCLAFWLALAVGVACWWWA